MKSNSVIATAVNVATRTVTFQVKDRPALVLDLGKVHADNIAYAALHGFKQRVADAAAMSKTDDEGRLIPEGELISAKYQAMQDLVEHYHSGVGQWGTRREGSQSEGGLLVRSLIELGGDPEKVRETVKSWDRATQAKVLASDKVRPVADRLRGPVGDVSDKLAELGI